MVVVACTGERGGGPDRASAAVAGSPARCGRRRVPMHAGWRRLGLWLHAGPQETRPPVTACDPHTTRNFDSPAAGMVRQPPDSACGAKHRFQTAVSSAISAGALQAGRRHLGMRDADEAVEGGERGMSVEERRPVSDRLLGVVLSGALAAWHDPE